MELYVFACDKLSILDTRWIFDWEVTVTITTVNVKKLTRGDSDFMFSHDGITLTPRASVEFSSMCPSSLIIQVQDAIAKGYIKPIAYMTDREYVWEKLNG